MMQLIQRQRMLLAPALTAALIATFFFFALAILNNKQDQYQQVIEKLKPRIERAQGLLRSTEKITERHEQLLKITSTHLYPSSIDDNRLNIEIQSRLRELAQQTGLTISSLRQASRREENGLDVFSVNLNLQGGITELTKFIEQLRNPLPKKPTLYIESITLRPAGFSSDSLQAVTIDITVAALRAAAAQTSKP